jgi:hypothetical protein
MANQFSTGLAIGLNGSKGLKELMDDFVIKYYGGTPPTISAGDITLGYSHADAAATGNLLATFTKGGATLTGTASTRQDAYVVVTNGSTNDTVTLTFTVPSKTLVYTQVAGDSSDDIFTTSLATAINADSTLNKVVRAHPLIGASITENIVYLEAIFPGEPFALTVGATGDCSAVLTAGVSNARINSLHFDYPNTYGDVSNEAAYTWNATGLVADTATYFRVVKPTDDGTLSHSQERIQGNIATAGAEINLQPSAQIVVGQPLSITSYKVSVKKSVA